MAVENNRLSRLALAAAVGLGIAAEQTLHRGLPDALKRLVPNGAGSKPQLLDELRRGLDNARFGGRAVDTAEDGEGSLARPGTGELARRRAERAKRREARQRRRV